jgi:multisubunit Na+/H+ antiporter MnhB subunit
MFTKIGTVAAHLGLWLGLSTVAMALLVSNDPNQNIFPKSGRVIDLAIYTIWGSLILGVICEISKAVSQPPQANVGKDTDND